MSDLMSRMMEMSSGDTPTNEELEAISSLAKRQVELEYQIANIEAELKKFNDELINIRENLLPEAMINCGMQQFTLASGHKVSIKSDVYASIRKEYVDQAVKWLDNNGLGGIVKDQVSVDFGRGEYASVSELMEFCKSAGMQAVEKLSVHPSTLKATVKEQMRNGVVFPDEFFSIVSKSRADINIK